MRLIVDSLVALMLVGILTGMVMHYRHTREIDQRLDLAREELHRLQSQITLQAALERTELTKRGYPEIVEADWFAGDLPTNPLLPAGHPWLEIAGESQKEMWHPPDKMASSREMAQFWYNPHTGIVRARVPADVSDATALRLYNRVNDAALEDLPAVDR